MAVLECFKKFQKNFRDASNSLQLPKQKKCMFIWIIDITMSKENVKGVTSKFHAGFKKELRLLQESFRGVSRNIGKFKS